MPSTGPGRWAYSFKPSTTNPEDPIYDNDAAGVAQLQQTLALRDLPANISVIKLPDLPVGTLFKTVGPGGDSFEEINERAASIEAYLDHQESAPHARIRWTSFVSSLNSYQGELEDKGSIVRDFLKRSDFSKYDFTKIDSILDAIVQACREIAIRATQNSHA
jgi:hypothetical protein